MVDNQAVAELNLPKSTDSPQPGRTELPSCPAEGAAKAAEGEARKFSLGVTLWESCPRKPFGKSFGGCRRGRQTVQGKIIPISGRSGCVGG